MSLASPPATVRVDASLSEAARRMGRAHVGSLVVVDDAGPVGLVTDRDVVLAACLREPDAAAPQVGEVASRPLVTLAANAPLDALTALCAQRCIRRVGLVDEAGALVGVVAVDSVVQYLGGQLGDLARALGREFAEERAPTATQRTFGPE
ncbi:MAG: CBS domain-containing protein [Planctomycetota bacterium]